MDSSSVDRLRFGSFIDRRDIGRLAAAGRWRANAGPAGNHYRDRVSDVNGDFYADFSRDNRQLAFARCATGSCNVMVMPVSGGRPRHIATDSVQGLTWSPDGRTIVFSSKRPGQDRLWRLAVSGLGEVQLIALAGDGALHPRFGRNAAVGPRLIFEHHIETAMSGESIPSMWQRLATSRRSGRVSQPLAAASRLTVTSEPSAGNGLTVKVAPKNCTERGPPS
jgi:WD40 repeat protein